MFYTPRTFIQAVLPNILQGTHTLHGIFATYNSVDEYRTGPVDTGKRGLTIDVQNRHAPMNFEQLFVLGAALDGSLPPELGNKAVREMQADASAAQHTVCVNVHASVSDRGSNFALIYAGLTAYRSALECATHLKTEGNATVYVLTCDCDLHDKSAVFDEAVRTGAIDGYIVTNHCGGRGDMRDILEALIEQFPHT